MTGSVFSSEISTKTTGPWLSGYPMKQLNAANWTVWCSASVLGRWRFFSVRFEPKIQRVQVRHTDLLIRPCSKSLFFKFSCENKMDHHWFLMWNAWTDACMDLGTEEIESKSPEFINMYQNKFICLESEQLVSPCSMVTLNQDWRFCHALEV